MFIFKYHNRSVIQIFLICTLLIILINLSSCNISDPCRGCQDEFAMESFDHTYTAEGLTEFELRGVNGNIEIIGVAGQDSVEIWGDKIVRSETGSDAETYLELLQVDIQISSSKLTVETQQPRESNGRTYEIDYHVRVPQSLKVQVESVNGAVQICQIINDVQSDLVNGNIELEDIEGSCQAAVVNGQIDSNVELSGQEFCMLNTVNGNIRLSVPKTTSARINAEVVNGSISFSGLQIQNMITSKTTASGVIGDGTGSIRVQTVNGNIEVRGE